MATQFFYSVCKNAASLYSANASASSGTLTLAASASNGIGVGCEIREGSNRYYIRQRNSDTEFLIQNSGANSGTPGSTAITFSLTAITIYHAYSTISAAEAGASDSSHMNSADLVSSDFQLTIACYYNATADSTLVIVSGYTTDNTRYVKIYTPVTSSEVGESQRHAGKYSTTVGFRMEMANQKIINFADEHIRVEGLIFYVSGTDGQGDCCIYMRYASDVNSPEWHISHNVMRGYTSNSESLCCGVLSWNDYTFVLKIKVWNNLIYDFSGSSNSVAGIREYYTGTSALTYYYNNTCYNCRTGIWIGHSTCIAKNNISINNTDAGYQETGSGSWHTDCNKNASSDADAPGTDPISLSSSNATNYFDAADNLHIDPDATDADEIIAVGENVFADSDIAVTDDIDGDSRASTGFFELGGDALVTVVDDETVIVIPFPVLNTISAF